MTLFREQAREAHRRAQFELPCRLELLKSEVPKYLKYEVLNEVQQSLFIDRHSKHSGPILCTDLQGASLKRYVDTTTCLCQMPSF
jgi:hypothetical protein